VHWLTSLRLNVGLHRGFYKGEDLDDGRGGSEKDLLENIVMQESHGDGDENIDIGFREQAPIDQVAMTVHVLLEPLHICRPLLRRRQDLVHFLGVVDDWIGELAHPVRNTRDNVVKILVTVNNVHLCLIQQENLLGQSPQV
jgi:hypothetical protein